MKYLLVGAICWLHASKCWHAMSCMMSSLIIGGRKLLEFVSDFHALVMWCHNLEPPLKENEKQRAKE